MLVLTRKKEQTILIGDQIEITILDIKGDNVKIGISAPKEISILREEVYLEVKEANKNALVAKNINLAGLGEIIQKQLK